MSDSDKQAEANSDCTSLVNQSSTINSDVNPYTPFPHPHHPSFFHISKSGRISRISYISKPSFHMRLIVPKSTQCYRDVNLILYAMRQMRVSLQGMVASLKKLDFQFAHGVCITCRYCTQGQYRRYYFLSLCVCAYVHCFCIIRIDCVRLKILMCVYVNCCFFKYTVNNDRLKS